MRVVLLFAIAVLAWLYLFRGKSQASTAQSQGTALGGDNPDGGDQLIPDSDAGAASGLDALGSVVQAVIQAESGGRQTDASGNTLRSSAGALGLMQLMPSTAAQYGADPDDADQNVRGGTAYLKALFNKYGDWFDALAAYNWGPGNVDRALSNGSDFPSGVQAYASRVMVNAGV